MKALARKIRRPLTIGIALLVFAAIPGLALAQTDDTAPPSDRAVTDRPLDDRPERDRDRDLEGTKARILEAIDKRLAALDRLSEVAKENEHLTKEHEKDLQDDYKDAEKILDDAAIDVEKAETLAELREVVPAAFENTLVFALQTPKTRLAWPRETCPAHPVTRFKPMAPTAAIAAVAPRRARSAGRFSPRSRSTTTNAPNQRSPVVVGKMAMSRL